MVESNTAMPEIDRMFGQVKAKYGRRDGPFANAGLVILSPSRTSPAKEEQHEISSVR